jgi:hypothetical protein
MPLTPFDVTKVKSGPGKLRFAAVSSTEPADLITAWAAAWVQVGYTDAGHTFTYTPAFDDVEVAEEYLPIRTVQTGLDATVEFSAAETTSKNIQTALNGGTITTGTGIVTFDPPAFGSVTYTAIGWESDAADERWVYRKCLQTGATAFAREKAPSKTLVPMTFRLQTVSAVIKPWKAILSEA